MAANPLGHVTDGRAAPLCTSPSSLFGLSCSSPGGFGRIPSFRAAEVTAPELDSADSEEPAPPGAPLSRGAVGAALGRGPCVGMTGGPLCVRIR